MHKLSHCLHSLLINHSFIQKNKLWAALESMKHSFMLTIRQNFHEFVWHQLKDWNQINVPGPSAHLHADVLYHKTFLELHNNKSFSILLKGWSRWRLTFSFRWVFEQVPIFCHFVVKLHECSVEYRIPAFSALVCHVPLCLPRQKSSIVLAETHLTSKEVSADLHYNLVILVGRLVPGHHHFCTGQVLQLVYLQSQRKTPK